MVLDRDVLQVKINRGLVGGTGLQVGKAEAQVTRLYDASQVNVTAEAKGPLPDLLTVVNTSPLGPLMDKALAQTTATGVADYKLKLGFPVSDVNKATVQGSIVLSGNDLQIIPDTPKFSRARGTINFTESGFSLAGAQARALGGDIKVEGGLSFVAAPATAPAARTAPNQLRFSGTATAEGLRQSRELGAAGRLAQFATGSTSYTASLGFRSGVAGVADQLHPGRHGLEFARAFGENSGHASAGAFRVRADTPSGRCAAECPSARPFAA